MTTPMDDVVRVGAGRWRIRSQRAQGGHSAAVEVIVRGPADAPAAGSPLRAFAAARAWLALARERQAAQDSQAALDAARAGLAELGQSYKTPGQPVIDDTSIHIDLADELAGQAKMPDAARRMIGALDDRLGMYAQANAETITE